jgi:hypothetical protein
MKSGSWVRGSGAAAAFWFAIAPPMMAPAASPATPAAAAAPGL